MKGMCAQPTDCGVHHRRGLSREDNGQTAAVHTVRASLGAPGEGLAGRQGPLLQNCPEETPPSAPDSQGRERLRNGST